MKLIYLEDEKIVYIGTRGEYERYNIPQDIQIYEERKEGNWEYIRTEYGGNAYYICSVCGAGDLHVPTVKVRYCWNCGAKMVDEDE